MTRTVVVDARMLAYPLTGIGRYVLELLSRLVRRPETRWVLLSARPIPATVRAAFTGAVEWIEGSPTQRAEWWTQRTAVRELERRPEASFLGLASSVPFFGPRQRRSALVVYDLSSFVVPTRTRPSDFIKAIAVTLPSLWKADRLLAISPQVAAELARYIPGTRHRTTALPLGGTRLTAGAPEPFERRHGFLAVGSYPRKNTGLLLEAYARLPQDVRARHPLSIVARELPARLARRVGELGLGGDVRLVPDASDHALGQLHSHCVALVYPSPYEGLGLPVAEAILSGLPSIVAGDTPMDQFLGGAGIVLRPLAAATLAQAMEQLVSDRRVWERCVASAARVAPTISWDAVAEAAARVLEL
jgi:glycosyltransferase involved in cell wall biosynthesis